MTQPAVHPIQALVLTVMALALAVLALVLAIQPFTERDRLLVDGPEALANVLLNLR